MTTRISRRPSQLVPAIPSDQALTPLVPERDYAPAAAKRCMRAGSIVVGEVANEYAAWVGR